MTTGRALEMVIDRVAELLHLHIGLRPDKALRGRLHRAVRDEASRHGEDPTAYVERLMADRNALQGLMNRVTVQETGFFRHPEQFEVLERDVLPGLPRPVRIWSAACANGQEAYSLAMLLEEGGIAGEVIATDLSTAALQRTQAARYARRELSGLSPDRLARHFTRTGDHWQVNQPVRDRVSILHHNLLDPLPPKVRSCEVVFCRNVLIYLAPEQVRLFLDRVADELASTTTLFVGAAETIWQVSDRFKAVHVGEAFLYRRRGPEPRRSVATEPRPARPQEGAVRTRVGRRALRETVGPVRSIGRPDSQPGDTELAALESLAQVAFAAGDYEAAVVAFRKCAYLTPHDPVAQLHLGLALEASGDDSSARRAFAAARRALADAGPEQAPSSLEGYSVTELHRLLDSKR